MTDFLTTMFIPWFLIILAFISLLIYFRRRAYLTKRQFMNSSYSYASGNSYKKTLANLGTYGEYLTYLELEKLDGDKRILTDLYIPIKDGKTTEIDLVLIHPTGIYVFESKNYSGCIFGNEAERYWTQYLNSETTNKLYNPIWQNSGHITALSKALGRGYDDYFYSYVVFSERCDLKMSSDELQSGVVLKRNILHSKLRQDMRARVEVFMKSEMDELEMGLKAFALADNNTKTAHMESVISKYKD